MEQGVNAKEEESRRYQWRLTARNALLVLISVNGRSVDAMVYLRASAVTAYERGLAELRAIALKTY